MTVLVTGAHGFVGKNLVLGLRPVEGLEVLTYGSQDGPAELESALNRADVVFHLAGVNRPPSPDDYEAGNAGITRDLVDTLRRLGRTPKIVYASSIQAEQDNPYGLSKRHAEEALTAFGKETGAEIAIYRLKNVFGKWCRPNYNSVTATFCYNVAHGLPLQVNDPSRELDLVYIDDIVAEFKGELTKERSDEVFRQVPRSTKVTLGRLAELIQGFRDIRTTLVLPNMEDRFVQELYVTYLSYLETPDFAYDLDVKTDNRGFLAEVVKSRQFGQIFISRTKPGITRGNHYHHTKTEKFLVVEGEAVVRFRNMITNEIVEHPVNGMSPRVVDIPPGWTHSIENVGDSELVTLFWASEIFDPGRPDTVFEAVLP